MIKIHRFLYQFMVCFMFLAFYSECRLMESESESEGEFSSSSGSEATRLTTSTPFENLDRINQKSISTLINAYIQESRAPTTNELIGGIGLGGLSLVISATVFPAFAYLSLYLFEDGIPGYDNSTCTYNATTPFLTSTVSADGWQDALYTVVLAAPPAVTGVVASLSDGGSFVVNKSRSILKWVGNCWRRGCKPEENPDPGISVDIESANSTTGSMPSPSLTCFQESFERLQRWSHSWPVTLYGGFFWSSFYLNFISTTFIKNYPDDRTRGIVYSAVFGGASLPLIWYLFTHLTGLAKNAGNSYDHQLLARSIVRGLREKISEGNLSPEMITLVKAINGGSATKLSQLEDAFANVFPEISAFLDNHFSQEKKRVKNTYYGSLAIQLLNLSMKLLAQGSMWHKLGWVIGLSPDTSLKMSISLTILSLPLLFLGSLREQSLVQSDLYQLPQYFSMPRSAYAASLRLGNLAAAGTNLFYLTIPTWWFFQRDILYNWFCHTYLIPDLRLRAPLAALFCMGAGWAPGRQFFDRQYERIISKAFEMGDPCLSATPLTDNGLSKREIRQFERNLDRLLYLLIKNKYELPKKEVRETMELLPNLGLYKMF